MKKSIILLALGAIALTSAARQLQTIVLTTVPQMHCQNCENKIKSNLRFEKGITDIKTDVKAQTVTITFDADKNAPANIIKAFSKIGYEACEIEPETTAAPADSTSCCK